MGGQSDCSRAFRSAIVCSLFSQVVTDVDRNVNQVNKSDLNAQRVVTSVTFVNKQCHSKRCSTKSKSRVLNQISANNKNSTKFSKFYQFK